MSVLARLEVHSRYFLSINTFLLFSCFVVSSTQVMQTYETISAIGEINYGESGMLYVEGNTIRDNIGPIFLAGVNTRGSPTTLNKVFDDFWTHAESDAETIKGYGFNAIRLVPYWAVLETSQSPAEFTYNETYLTKIVETVKAFTSRGIYVLLNIHTCESLNGMDPLKSFLPIEENAFGDSFFSDIGPTSGREHLRRLWLKLSDIFENETGVCGYDILNEPHHSGLLTSQEVHDYWWRNLDYIVSALRSNNDNHIIFVEDAPWASVCNLMKRKMNDSNIVYAPHWYQGLDTMHYPITVVNNDLDWLTDTFMRLQGDTLTVFNVPFVWGELGLGRKSVDSDSPEDIWLCNSLTVFNEHSAGCGFFYWVYWNDLGTPQADGWPERLIQYSIDKPIRFYYS